MCSSDLKNTRSPSARAVRSVFFGKRGRVDHVGIYIGEGKFLHAPRTGRDVTVSSLDSGYWSQKYLQARRLATGA